MIARDLGQRHEKDAAGDCAQKLKKISSNE
jgi:hypothetical protein